MNSKVIAAGVVVALCAVALIGVGYAYTATVTDTNEFDSEYVVLTIEGTGSQYADAIFEGNVLFNTATVSTGTTWTAPVQTIASSGAGLKISKTNVGDSVTSIKLKLETSVSQVTGADSNLRDNNIKAILEGAEITFSKAEGTSDDVVYKNNAGTWTVTSTNTTFDVTGTYTATLKTSEVVLTENTSPDSKITFTMTLTYDSKVA